MGETNLTENTSSGNISSGRKLLRSSYLNKNMKIKLTDGRILIGIFLCTDKDANVILGTCAEYLTEENSRDPRMLGLAMIPGRHIISIHVDETLETSVSKIPAPKNSPTSSSMYN